MRISILYIIIVTFMFGQSLQDVIDKVSPYSKIELPNGIFEAPIYINKPLILQGLNNTVIQGSNRGTLLHVKGSHITIENIIFKGTGNQRYSLDSAIRVDQSKNITIKKCKFENILFGIILYDSQNSLIEENIITSYNEPVADNRGDSIRLWSCKDIVIKENNITNSRDISINRSKNITVTHNYEKGGRYGILLNISRDINISNNKIFSNYIGIMCEGGKNIDINNNDIIKTHLSTGTGIMLTENKNIHIYKNRLKAHAQAIYFSNSSAELDMQRYIEYNQISNNNTAWHRKPNCVNHL